MTGKDIIMIGVEELKRLRVIRKVLDKELTQRTAATTIELSDRQVRRLVSAVRKEGDRGVVHKARGRPSNRKLTEKLKRRVLRLYEKKYQGFGPTLAVEKLEELDQAGISRETLRRWLLEKGWWSRRRQRRAHRRWRPRKPCFGQMVQMDGSHHDWLEGRGPRLVLLAYIDDATSNVHARFYEYEGTQPAFSSFKAYALQYGLPQSVYLDRHSTYKSTQKPSLAEELEGRRQGQSQFQRAMAELGVQVIHAHSPQAKGRVERLFLTLQDRLVKEMRLRGIKTLAQANRFVQEYLPVFNRKFCVAPAEPADLHRPVPGGLDLDDVLCIQTPRTVRNDGTVAHDKKLYQILDTISRKDVVVEERIDGSLRITQRGVALKHQLILARPPLAPLPVAVPRARPRKPYVPPADHPWRKYKGQRQAVR